MGQGLPSFKALLFVPTLQVTQLLPPPPQPLQLLQERGTQTLRARNQLGYTAKWPRSWGYCVGWDPYSAITEALIRNPFLTFTFEGRGVRVRN